MDRLKVPTRDLDANGHDSIARNGNAAANWLFVGRIVPHKGQHRLVQALASYIKLYGGEVRLDLVGSTGSFRYADAVKQLSKELGVGQFVHFSRGVDDIGLGGFYADADVFVSASVHEGFCVPIVEAMHAGVPVVALAAAAVPETVRSAGLLVDLEDAETVDPALMATSVHKVVTDQVLRSRLIGAGHTRAAELSLHESRPTMRNILESWIDRIGPANPARTNPAGTNRVGAA